MKKTCLFSLLLLGLAITPPTFAEWLGNAGLGMTYNNNYALQNGNYTNIAQDKVDRTGTEFSAGLGWQNLQNDGGYSIDFAGLIDRATDRNNSISNISLSASRMLPFSTQWLGRFSGRLVQYRNDDFTASSYDGGSLETTFGWFGKKGRGLDINLSAIYEDHSENPAARYKTHRLGANVVYFFPHNRGKPRNSISIGLQNHDADDNRRDGTSIIASADMDQIRWGNQNTLRLSVSWRQDRYQQAYAPLPGDRMSGFPTSGAFGGGMGMPGSTNSPRIDSQLYLNAYYQYPLSREQRLFLSASSGQYSSPTGDDSFYNAGGGIRYFFD